MEITVFIQNEHVIPETAELIGVKENELKKRFKAAQEQGNACVFKVTVSAEQWLEIMVRQRAS